MELTAEINTKRMERAIRLAPKFLKEELGDGMDFISRRFLKRFRSERLQGPPGVRGSSGRGLFGTFKRVSLVSKDIEGMGMMIFSESKVARLHEEGGRVSDPGGGRLAVPLYRNLEMFTSTGKLRQRYKKPRDLKNVHPVEIEGKTYLARVKKRSREIKPLYVLKRSVRIKPRLQFLATWDRMSNERIEILNRSIKRALERL